VIAYGHSSTNPANLAKIGPVDVEIIGGKNRKNTLKTVAEHIACRPAFSSRAG